MNALEAARWRDQGRVALTQPVEPATQVLRDGLLGLIARDWQARLDGTGAAGPDAWAQWLQGALEAIAGQAGSHRRKTQGAYYTPPHVVEGILAMTLQPAMDAALATADPAEALAAVTVLDPACGGGAFLLGAARRLASAWKMLGAAYPWRAALAQLEGWDVDAVAIALASAALRWQADDRDVTLRLGVRDALLDPRPWQAQVVIGNPPFLGQLKRSTARSAAERQALAARFGERLQPYTDSSALFLARAVDDLAVLPGRGAAGVRRVGLVTPLSLLAARDAAAVRRGVEASASLEAFWYGPATPFDGATVDVCAAIVAVGAQPRERTVQVHGGAAFAQRAGVPVAALTTSWAPLMAAASGLPQIHLARAGCIGDMAVVTADFRDQFYGLQPFVHEAGGEMAEAPRLVLTAHIDPLHCRWGEQEVRFGGRRLRHPVVDVASLRAHDPKLGRWAVARQRPKLVLATQSRVIECAIDARGQWINTTPTLAVLAAADDLDALAAVLSSAALTVWAWSQHGGTALTATALKLSARQVAALPLPADRAQWLRAASAVAEYRRAAAADRREALETVSRLASEAYLGRGAAAAVAAWCRLLDGSDVRRA